MTANEHPTILQRRQATIDKFFPNGDQVGCHKFRAETGECAQCHIKFLDWLEPLPDGRFTGGMAMCPVIGRDEVERFRDYEG